MRQNLPLTLQQLSESTKRDATYLSKFVASSAIGLYDAALNYLWNEVVLSLRNRVNIYGLDLFYDAAVGGELRDTYSTYEDLVGIKDNTLIDGCRKLELISDVLHEKLKHILFMRNNIGASHPTGDSIRTFELLGWLETCVKDIIADKPSDAAIYIQQLIVNLKNESLIIDDAKLEQIKGNLNKQNTSIAGTLLSGLFGIFTKKNTSPNVRSNILLLAPIVWDASPDNKKYEIGHKPDQFTLNLDTESEALANSFLEKCNALQYKSEGAKASEINQLLERLMDEHHSMNNYHKEVPIARRLRKYIVTETDILPSIQDKLIKAMLTCRMGNGRWYCEGVSPGAKEIYNEIIRLFNSSQINLLIKYMSEPELKNQLIDGNCNKHAIQILELINLDLQEGRTREAIEFMIGNLATYKQ